MAVMRPWWRGRSSSMHAPIGVMPKDFNLLPIHASRSDLKA